jgi:hypothetical protein
MYGYPNLWVFVFPTLPSSLQLSTLQSGWVYNSGALTSTNYAYVNSNTPVQYSLGSGCYVPASNYIVAVIQFTGAFTWWSAHYNDTNTGSYTHKYPTYYNDSLASNISLQSTNQYGSADMYVNGYSLQTVTNFAGYMAYVQSGVNSNSTAVVTATNTAKTDLIATNGLLVTRFNATNDLLATRINGVTNGASAWTVSGTTTRLANTNTTNVVSYGILTTAGVASTASNGQAVASLVLTNAPYCWTNGTGRNVTLYLSRGVVNGVTVNGSVVATNSTGYFIDEVMTLSLQPNEWFSCSVSNDATTNLPLMTTKPF